MKRALLIFAASVALLLGLSVSAALAAPATFAAPGAPATFAAESKPDTGRVLVSVSGSVNVPAGDHLDTLVVIDGNAQVGGYVRTIVVVRGTATLSAATAQTVVVVDGTADLQAGTTVLGNVRTLGGSVTQQAGATVLGSVQTLDGDLAALAWLLIPALILLFIGFALAALASALFVAAFAGRQVRSVEALISREPGRALVAGIAGTILLPIAAMLLVITVVGAPIGLALLFFLLPVTAFLAWIVAAIWIGDWLVNRFHWTPEPDRPYRAAALGVIVLAIAGLIPFTTLIASLFGFGALLLTAWRTLTRQAPPLTATSPTQPALSAS